MDGFDSYGQGSKSPSSDENFSQRPKERKRFPIKRW